MKKDIVINNANAYHSYPDDGQKHPGLILIEEIWGVNEHIKSVADRYAAEGFSVLAPELLPESILNMITPELQQDLFDPAKRNELQPKLREAMQPIMQPQYAQKTVATLKACVDYLLNDVGANGNVGVLGFCFGGTYSFHLAAFDKRIKAAVPFYGQAPSAKEISNIACPILAFYGDQDTNLIQSLPQLKEDMKKHQKDFRNVVYSGAGHAFFNNTNVRQYRPEAARDAWERSVAFLKEHVD